MIQETLQNEVFLFFSALVGGLLILGGLILLVLDKILHKNVLSVWRIYRGWLFIIPLVFGSVILGRVALIVGVFGLSIVGFSEFSRATRLNQHRWVLRVVYLGIFSVAILAIMRDPRTGYFGAYGVFMALPVYVISLILLVPILQNRYEGQVQAVALGITGFVYFGWMFGHLSLLANSAYAVNYLLYIVFAVQLTDISAYSFGRLLGRHKLRSNISPNKTVEGSVGALFVSLCLPWLFRGIFPQLGPFQLILTGLIVGVGGQLGDLTISFMKRDMSIKDMGTTIPGHGGILDRIDSLIYVAPLFFHMIRYFGLLYP